MASATTSPETGATRTRDAIDFAVRALFFATAPFWLVLLAEVFPITGALVQIALALVIFFVGEAARQLASRSKLARLALGSQLAFEAYYRKHAPRPFLYYVFYPLLFPYWLSNAPARKEFLLFKGYTLLSFGLLLVSLGVQYLRAFPPELTVKDFLPIALGTFAAETVVVLMFLMPIVTSVVHFHTTGGRRRLIALLLLGMASVTVAVMRLERRREPIVSYATRQRVRLRTGRRPVDAKKAQLAALHAAWRALPQEKDDLDSDGKVEGVPLDDARAALADFYKNDEANSFDLWYAKNAKSALMVVFFEARPGKPPIWMAMDRAGVTLKTAKELPRGAFVAMSHAAE